MAQFIRRNAQEIAAPGTIGNRLERDDFGFRRLGSLLSRRQRIVFPDGQGCSVLSRDEETVTVTNPCLSSAFH
jgi:hypothetical protein